MSSKKLNKLLLDAAEANSYNVESAEQYLKEEDVDFDKYLTRGLDELNSTTEPKQELSKSQSFFRRVVLAAKIAHECHSERTFGSVKFQKLVFLCEKVSNMNFSTNYSKQAAGPMDNKFIHSVKPQFEKQGWFSVKKVKDGNFEKVQFTPLENVNNYKQYYSKYYSDEDSDIQHLIDTFRRWKTNDVELVATIYSCWLEINDENSIFSEPLLVQKFYAFHKKKKKFSEKEILTMLDWMKEKGICPTN